jgi:hypothetical protein
MRFQVWGTIATSPWIQGRGGIIEAVERFSFARNQFLEGQEKSTYKRATIQKKLEPASREATREDKGP